MKSVRAICSWGERVRPVMPHVKGLRERASGCRPRCSLATNSWMGMLAGGSWGEELLAIVLHGEV